MNALITGIVLSSGLVALAVLVLAAVLTRLYRKVPQGKVLIISKTRRVDVSFTGAVVLPVLHRAEVMDISVKTIEIERSGNQGLLCRDNIRADIKIMFFVKINKTHESCLQVAQAIGTVRASHEDTLQELFNAKFSEALKTVGKQFDFVDLYTHRHEFRDQIVAIIGTDLNGYYLEDAAIDHLEQTPLFTLDTNNILDAQGIRKITELTALEHIRTNSYQRNEEKEITKQNVDARETILELERRQAEAEVKKRREIETVRAREEAEIARVQAEERLISQAAALRTDEQLGVQQENKNREIAVAEKNRERVIAVENERIEKDRMLEVIARERETELRRISKDKEIEGERRDVAEVIRERIAVERTVAEQEEAIKKVRVVEQAERDRASLIIHAEAAAQELLVKDIKAAEAAAQAALHRKEESLTLAEARERSADLDAAAKIRLAEGDRAEAAAAGLAEVEVRAAAADAEEKYGLVEARVTAEKGRGEAAGIQAMLEAEAEGLTRKAEAMAALDEAGRGHEEFRLLLAAEKEIRTAGLDVQKEIAIAQASVVAAGLEHADIDIVGGDSVFFDKLVGAVTAGKAVDGFVRHSDTARALGEPYLNGTRNLPGELIGALGSVSTEDLKNLSLSAVLAQRARTGLDPVEHLAVADGSAAADQ
ncbi:flotillin family protein [Actinocorallia longicatena]|uniref:Membrane protein YqiK n=1 Tax=Actinocorallia longicatena TaxID=111803 RepID=A0ABP6QME8_9ACTN